MNEKAKSKKLYIQEMKERFGYNPLIILKGSANELDLETSIEINQDVMEYFEKLEPVKVPKEGDL